MDSPAGDSLSATSAEVLTAFLRLSIAGRYFRRTSLGMHTGHLHTCCAWPAPCLAALPPSPTQPMPTPCGQTASLTGWCNRNLHFYRS